VVHIPGSDVFGVILPAMGIQLLIGNVYYTYLARRLARRENRDDVTAMPYGPSVPHMFIVTFVIMLPTYLTTHNAFNAWAAGLAGLLVGTAIGWIGGYMHPADVTAAAHNIALSFPSFNFGRLGHGLSEVSPLLATAVPLGIYNFTEGMSNVESAAAAGDSYNL